MSRPLAIVAIAGFALAAVSTHAAATTTTWNFAGNGGDISGAKVFDSGPSGRSLSAAAFAFSAGTLSNFAPGDSLALHQTDEGLGAFGGRGSYPCGTRALDGCDPSEFIRFEFGTNAWDPVSVTLTGLDSADDWLVLGDNDGDLSNGATLLASGSGTSPVLTIDLLGVTPFKFLYVRPAVDAACTTQFTCAPKGEPDGNNDFRVLQVQGQTVAVPEPQTWWLLCFAGMLMISAAAVWSRIIGLRR